jgi:NIPSNAP protein
MSRFVEFRTYNLRPGSGQTFHTLVSQKCLPLLRKWNIDVLAAAPSLHDKDSYFLIRVYRSLDQRQESQDEFYGSADWRQGPREAIMALIENYTSVVVELSEESVAALRASFASGRRLTRKAKHEDIARADS